MKTTISCNKNSPKLLSLRVGISQYLVISQYSSHNWSGFRLLTYRDGKPCFTASSLVL